MPGRQPTPIVLDPPALDPEAEAEEARIADIMGEDDGPPSGAQHGENHTRREGVAGAQAAQGPKTRAANRERAKGSRLHNPR